MHVPHPPYLHLHKEPKGSNARSVGKAPLRCPQQVRDGRVDGVNCVCPGAGSVGGGGGVGQEL